MARTRKPEWATSGIEPLRPDAELMVTSPPLRFDPLNPFRKRVCIQCGDHLAGRICRALTAVFRGFADDPGNHPASLTAFVHDDCGRPDPSWMAEVMLWAWREHQKARWNEAILSVLPTRDMPVTEISDGDTVYTLRWGGQ